MTHLLLLSVLLQADPKITATLAEAPGPRFVCEGTAEVPDGIVLNVEIFIGVDTEKLAHHPVQVKGGKYAAAFDLYKGRERNLPGHYRARVHYHPAFQPQPLPGVDPFHVETPLRVGTPEEIETAHKAVRERMVADLKEFAAVADEVVAAFDAAQEKPAPPDWRAKAEAWRARCAAVERRAGADPDYRALGFGKITLSGTEALRNTVRALVEYGGAGRGADLRLGRQQLDGLIRSYVVELAPPGSTTAERRDLIGRARGAALAALEADGDRLAETRRAFTESMLGLGVKATDEVRAVLLDLSAESSAYFELAGRDREAARKRQPELDRKLSDLLQRLTATE